MQIVFLGTSCMAPTKERNVQGIYLEYKGEGILMDCGEGTQRQMNIASINRNKVKKILISHWHGDHVGGLISLLQTMSNVPNPNTIYIYGPPGTKDKLQHLLKSIEFDATRIPLKITEIDSRTVTTFYESDEYKLQAILLKHSVPCIGYSFVEKDRTRINVTKANKLGLKQGRLLGNLSKGKSITLNNKTIKPEEVNYTVKGKKITFIFDTMMCNAATELAESSDLLISEATHTSQHEEQALKYKHLTAEQTAMIATQAGVKKLIITHFSQRYGTSEPLLKEATKHFPNTQAAHDLMKVKI